MVKAKDQQLGRLAGRPADLTASALAADGQFVAVAARAHAGDAAAMRTLGENAQTEEAFRWGWALLSEKGKDTDQRFQQFGSGLGSDIVVPTDLRESVSGFLMASQKAPSPRQPSPADAVRSRLLLSLSDGDGYAQEVALGVLDGDADSSMRKVALTVLGRSRSPVHRARVVAAAATSSNRTGDVEVLTYLQEPLDDQEETVVVDRVFAVLSQPMHDGVVAPLKMLVGRLPPQRVAALVRKVVGHRRAEQSLVESNLMTDLSWSAVRGLLSAEPPLPDALLERVVHQQANRLTSPRNQEQRDMAIWLHATFPAAWIKSIRDGIRRNRDIAARVGQRRGRTDDRSDDLELFRACTVASDSPDVANDYAQLLRPDEFSMPADSSAVEAERHGWVAGTVMNRIGESSADDIRDTFLTTIGEILASLKDEAARGFVRGILHVYIGDPMPLMRVVVRAGEPAIAAAAESGHGEELGAAAKGTGDPMVAANVIRAAAQGLSVDRTARLLRLVRWDSPAYTSCLDALVAHHPEALAAELQVAVTSLTTAASDRIPNDKMKHLLNTAIEAGVADDVAEDVVADGVSLMLAGKDVGLHTLALRWAAAATPSSALVEVVARANDRAVGMEKEFAATRSLMGRVLLERVHSDMPLTGRLEALKLAARADWAAARITAFSLMDDDHVEVRVGAATVLADTPSSPEDHDHLTSLIGEEHVAEVATLLQRALHQISSPDVGRALDQLFADFNIDVRPNTAQLLPYEEHHEAALRAIDDVRGNRGTGSTTAYVTALVILGDFIVDQFLVRMTEVDTGRKWLSNPDEARKVRSNANGRPTSGDLVHRPQLASQARWFAQHQTLRTLRKAHPAPVGSTTPLSPDGNFATRLFAMILTGWANDMPAADTDAP